MARGRKIGRLKLQIPPDEARERYLLEWVARELRFHPERFPRLDGPSLFDKQAPLEVEVGPGTGEYLCHLAQQQPGTNFLGIEASRKAVYQAVAQAANADLDNLLWLRANVKLLYPLFPQAAWQAIYLHFPDPVHKASDEKHRVFDNEFLEAAHRALAPGGRISVVSDDAGFFMDMLALAEEDGRFAKGHRERYLEGFEPGTKSRFQRFWEGKGVFPRQFILVKAD